MNYPQQPYPPQQPPYPPQQQPWQGYGPPPKKSNTGVIVAIVAVVVLALTTLGITGFVAPGFFLGDDESSGDAGSHDLSTPQAAAEALVAALKAKDAAAVRAVKCAGATADVEQLANLVSSVNTAELTGVQQQSDTQATVFLVVDGFGDRSETDVQFAKEGNRWCLSSLEGAADPPDPDAPSVEDGRAAKMQAFLDAINAGNEPGAAAEVCAGAQSYMTQRVSELLDGDANLRMTGAPTAENNNASGVDIGGTVNGSSVSGQLHAQSDDDGATWCVESVSTG